MCAMCQSSSQAWISIHGRFAVQQTNSNSPVTNVASTTPDLSIWNLGMEEKLRLIKLTWLYSFVSPLGRSILSSSVPFQQTHSWQHLRGSFPVVDYPPTSTVTAELILWGPAVNWSLCCLLNTTSNVQFLEQGFNTMALQSCRSSSFWWPVRSRG